MNTSVTQAILYVDICIRLMTLEQSGMSHRPDYMTILLWLTFNSSLSPHGIITPVSNIKLNYSLCKLLPVKAFLKAIPGKEPYLVPHSHKVPVLIPSPYFAVLYHAKNIPRYRYVFPGDRVSGIA